MILNINFQIFCLIPGTSRKTCLACFGRFLDSIRYFSIRNIQKITFASTRNSESPFLDPKLQFSMFIFPSVRSRLRTSDRDLECLAEIPNVRPRFRIWMPRVLEKCNPHTLFTLLEFIPGFSGNCVRSRRSDTPPTTRRSPRMT